MKNAIDLILSHYHSDLLEYRKAERDMMINPNEYTAKVLAYLSPRIKDYQDALIKLGYQYLEKI